MDECINVFFRTFIILVLLFFITKMMGKRQISQLSLFDYIVGITIGSIAADISLDVEKNLIAGIISVVIYGFVSYLISIITMKSVWGRRFLTGVPTVLVEKGKIIESGLKKTKLDINELLAEARIAGYFNLEEIDYAIMEINGTVSFLPKEKDRTITKKDMKIKCGKSGITANVVIDGKFMENNIAAIGKDKRWLDHQLELQGYDNYNDILLAIVDTNYKVNIYRKNVKSEKYTVLE